MKLLMKTPIMTRACESTANVVWENRTNVLINRIRKKAREPDNRMVCAAKPIINRHLDRNIFFSGFSQSIFSRLEDIPELTNSKLRYL